MIYLHVVVLSLAVVWLNLYRKKKNELFKELKTVGGGGSRTLVFQSRVTSQLSAVKPGKTDICSLYSLLQQDRCWEITKIVDR